jgi:multiple sugar transport system permease protein
MLPLARPAVIAIAVVAFLDQWRNFLWPLLITRSAEMQVAELALARVHRDFAANWPYQMAAAVLVTVPVLVVGLGALRYLARAHRVTGPRIAL